MRYLFTSHGRDIQLSKYFYGETELEDELQWSTIKNEFFEPIENLDVYINVFFRSKIDSSNIVKVLFSIIIKCYEDMLVSYATNSDIIRNYYIRIEPRRSIYPSTARGAVSIFRENEQFEQLISSLSWFGQSRQKRGNILEAIESEAFIHISNIEKESLWNPASVAAPEGADHSIVVNMHINKFDETEDFSVEVSRRHGSNMLFTLRFGRILLKGKNLGCVPRLAELVGSRVSCDLPSRVNPDHIKPLSDWLFYIAIIFKFIRLLQNDEAIETLNYWYGETVCNSQILVPLYSNARSYVNLLRSLGKDYIQIQPFSYFWQTISESAHGLEAPSSVHINLGVDFSVPLVMILKRCIPQ